MKQLVWVVGRIALLFGWFHFALIIFARQLISPAWRGLSALSS